MDQSAYGMAQFKVKYRTVELQVAPGAIASSLGTLKKGAVVTVIADNERYYYKVRLDNGLEGYIYKSAGVLANGAAPTPMPGAPETNGKGGALPPAGGVAPAGRSATYRNGSSPLTPSRPVNSSGRSLRITSGEIAVFDKPGIVGRQVAKLKRGDQVAMVGEDSFFFQVALPNGATGYIPRYSAEPN